MKNTNHAPLDSLKYVFSVEKDSAWIATIYGAFVGILSLVVPIGVQSLVNSVGFGSLLQPLVVLTTLIFAALCFSGILQLLQLYAVELLQCRIFARTALKASEMLLSDDLNERDGGRPGTSVSRFLEVSTLQKSAATLIVDGITLALQISIGMILLAFYHPYLLAFDLVLLSALIFIVAVLGRGAVDSAINESVRKYDVLESLESIQRAPLSFRSSQASGYIMRSTDLQVLQFLRARRRHFNILFKQAIGTYTLQAIASAILLGVGGWLVIQNQLTLGQLVAAELVLTGVLTSLSKLPKYFQSFYDLVASADKTMHLLEAPREADTGLSTLTERDLSNALALELNEVIYEQHSSGVTLSVPALSFAAQESVALFGPTGSGKSTFCDLVIRARLAERGSIKLAGFDIRDLRLGNLRNQVMLLRERSFLDGSISENISLWQSEDTDHNRLRISTMLSGLSEDAASLPQGLATHMSPSGAPLSDLDQIRLLIARAIYQRPYIILVDELFDAFDDATRIKLAKALIENCPHSTIIIATERSDLAALCKRQTSITKEGALWRIKA